MLIEYVSEYPRPPAIEIVRSYLVIYLENEQICSTNKFYRVLETFHPPTIYIHKGSFLPGTIHISSSLPSICEWKGSATYLDFSNSDGTNRKNRSGWTYHSPNQKYEELKNLISLYPDKFDLCLINFEKVYSQPGSFYGGWITKNIKGPFKGDPEYPELL